ncbi:MAG: hypothetical protein ACRCWB_11620 [Enterovibrio sp.]
MSSKKKKKRSQQSKQATIGGANETMKISPQELRPIWEGDPRRGFGWLIAEAGTGNAMKLCELARAEGWTKSKEYLNESIDQLCEPPYPAPFYNSTWVGIVKNLRLASFDEQKIAETLGIGLKAFEFLQYQHQALRDALIEAGAMADGMVAQALFERACGSKIEDQCVNVVGDQVVITAYEKSYPPDTASIKFWLKNRQPELWKEKVETVDRPMVAVMDTDAMATSFQKALDLAEERRKELASRADRLGLVLDGDSYE